MRKTEKVYRNAYKFMWILNFVSNRHIEYDFGTYSNPAYMCIKARKTDNPMTNPEKRNQRTYSDL